MKRETENKKENKGNKQRVMRCLVVENGKTVRTKTKEQATDRKLWDRSRHSANKYHKLVLRLPPSAFGTVAGKWRVLNHMINSRMDAAKANCVPVHKNSINCKEEAA